MKHKKIKLPSLEKAVQDKPPTELSAVKKKILDSAGQEIAEILSKNNLRISVAMIIGEGGTQPQITLKFQEER